MPDTVSTNKERAHRPNVREDIMSSKFIRVKQSEVRPGDIAFHKSGLDPRSVAAVDHSRKAVSIFLFTKATDFIPMSNYTFKREVQS